MIYKPQLIKELESLLNSSIDPSMFPYAKGNSIRIGNYIVRTNRKGYNKVFSLTDNSLVAETFCKTSAVALAKTLAKGNVEAQNNIMDADRQIMKHYNDCVFYKYTMRVSKDEIKKEVAETRYDIAKSRTLQAKSQLDRYIYA